MGYLSSGLAGRFIQHFSPPPVWPPRWEDEKVNGCTHLLITHCLLNNRSSRSTATEAKANNSTSDKFQYGRYVAALFLWYNSLNLPFSHMLAREKEKLSQKESKEWCLRKVNVFFLNSLHLHHRAPRYISFNIAS